jgi:hypothetical protein
MLKILNENETGYGILVENDAGFISFEKNKDIIKEFTDNLNDKSGNDIPFIKLIAVLQKYNTENKNGRVYTKDILERENIRYQQYIKMNISTGELNHPESSTIDGGRISHLITKTWWEGKTLMGELKLVITPGYIKSGIISCVGDIVLNLIRNGVTVGISSRGVGSLKKEGNKNIVQDDFELICWDIVTSPSTPGAWISDSSEKLKTFIENIENKNELINEKTTLFNKLNNFLLKS